jgi:hypothetical protein
VERGNDLFLMKIARRLRAVATELWPGGLTLVCRTCAREQHATRDQTVNYMACGWPTCHGETMTASVMGGAKSSALRRGREEHGDVD